MIKYIVYRADWLATGTGEIDPKEGWEIMKPSTEFDIRTERSSSFDSLEEATKFAEQVLASRAGDRWIATLEIRKAITETISIMIPPTPKCNGCDGSGWDSEDREGLCDKCDAACVCGTEGLKECFVHRGW